MPAIDFPASPAVNDEYSFEGRTWRWNGTGWEVKEYPAALALGTAANPSLYFTGDPNTGLYSPGADQVAISTGGTGRLFVDGSGNLQAGNPSSTRLEVVAGSVGVGERVHSYTNNYYIWGLRNEINDLAIESAFGGNIIFRAKNDGVNSSPGTATERLRITSAGLVGIGTSSPSEALTVSGKVQATTEFKSETGNDLRLNAGSVNRDIFMQVNGSTLMTVQGSTGRVGIGTTSPSAPLTVNGGSVMARFQSGSATDGRVEFAYNTTDVGYIAAPASDGFSVWARSGNYLSLGAGNLERARIDSSGRLLVGTSTARANLFNQTVSPGFQLEGTSTTNSSNRFSSIVFGDGGAPGPIIALGKHRSSSIGGVTVVASGDEIGQISFQGSDGTEFVEGATIKAEVDGTPGANDMPGRLVFSTTADGASSPTERMRISNAGAIGGFTASTEYVFYASSAASAGTTVGLFRGRYSATGMYGGTDSIFIYTNGNIQNTNNSYAGISDLKLKENIVDATSQWSDIKALQVRKYNFKDGQTHTQIGLVAQEVELVSPGLVTESPDRDAEGNDLGTVTKSVNYSVLYMKAVKALQEAMERIEVLEQRLTDAGIA